MEKEALIKKLNTKSTWSSKELLLLVKAMPNVTPKTKVLKVRVGDVYMHKGLIHPAIVIAKDRGGDSCTSVLLTTKEHEHMVLYKPNVRFDIGNVTNTICRISEKEVLSSYLVSIPQKEVTQIRKQLRNFYQKKLGFLKNNS